MWARNGWAAATLDRLLADGNVHGSRGTGEYEYLEVSDGFRVWHIHEQGDGYWALRMRNDANTGYEGYSKRGSLREIERVVMLLGRMKP